MKVLRNKIVLLVVVFLLVNSATFSQVPIPMAPPPPPPPGLPIDGGVVGLLIAGIFYGIFKIKSLLKN